MRPFWPSFLEPAAGISFNDWPETDTRSGYYSYYLSLSLNFKYIIPQTSAFGEFLGDLLNSFYIPAPVLQVYPRPGFKLIFYGHP